MSRKVIRLYELNQSAFAGSPMTEEKKMEKIGEYFTSDYHSKLRAKVEARREALKQEIAHATDLKKKAKSPSNLKLLIGY